MLQRLKRRNSELPATPAQPRVSLGAFGKHPGWDDHILGIGVETETLAQVKQALYIRGIGGQVDSGAWEQLPPDKRLAGYDHTFLWLRTGHVTLGQFWSSTDGKGRAKYPMVLCIDGEAVGPGFMLANFLSGLERLRDACKASTSAAQVTNDCRAAQEQVRAILASAGPRPSESPVAGEVRMRFWDHPDLGPEQVGFLRLLHEVNRAGNAKSCHLRLPMGNESPTDAALLWGDFLRGVIPEATPLLLLSRKGVNWLDVISGEPSSDDFFCLQASRRAMPLTTEIPYELSPELRPRLEALRKRFFGESTTSVPAAPPPGVQSQPWAPPAGTQAESASAPPAKRSALPLVLIGCVLLLAALAGAWFFWGRPTSSRSNPQVPPAPVVSNQPSPKANAPSASTEAYRSSMEKARTAFDRKDFSNALALVGAALEAKSNDPAALELRTNAQQQLSLVLAATERDQKFQAAMTSGQTALSNKDYATALARAVEASSLKPDDLSATKLKLEVQAQTSLAAAARDRAQKYQAALTESQAALNRKDYAAAIAQAVMALNLKSNDVAAAHLKLLAEQAQAQANQARDLAAAQSFYARADYAKAMELCRSYAGTNAFDSLAASIGDEQKLLQDALQKFAVGNYSFIEPLKNQICSSKPPFADLLGKASEEQKVLENLQALKAANNRSDANKQIRDLASAAFLAKPPFVALRQWAETPVVEKPASAETTAKLDAEFEKYLVQFRVLKATDPKILTAVARREKPADGQLSPEGKDWYISRLDFFKTEFQKAGILNQNDRQKNLEALRDVIEQR